MAATIIAKETSHMFMWFSDGSKIPEGQSPLPQNIRIDYIKRLKEECAKLEATKTPVFLVYMGRLLTDKQKILLENLENEISNLAVIDYDKVEEKISNDNVKSKVAELAKSYQEKEKLSVGNGGIANLVDFSRLVLLYNSKIVKNIAQKKIKIPYPKGIIYRDFDVTLEKETMPDIPTSHGYMAALNFLSKVKDTRLCLLEKNENKSKQINDFFNTHIYNLENYKKNLRLFSNNSLTDTKKKEELIKQYKEVGGNSFQHDFINLILTENSFLAISEDEDPLIEQMIKETCDGASPYAVVQTNFNKNFKKHAARINEFLTPQVLGFNIGNDLTWKITVKDQHQLENKQNPPNICHDSNHQSHFREIDDLIKIEEQKKSFNRPSLSSMFDFECIRKMCDKKNTLWRRALGFVLAVITFMPLTAPLAKGSKRLFHSFFKGNTPNFKNTNKANIPELKNHSTLS